MASRFACGALVVSLFACGGGGDDDNGTPDGGSNQEPIYTGDFNHYVTNELKIGANVSEAMQNGFPLDDTAPTLDNKIGQTLALLASQFPIDPEIASALAAGDFIILHSVRADSLTSDESVSWQIYLGEPTAPTAPDFSGNGSFTVQADTPTNARVGGSVGGSKFTTNPSFARQLTLELSITANDTLRVTLQSPRIEATFSGDGRTCSGKVGGAVKLEDLQNDILPFLAEQLDMRIQPATCRTTCNMTGAANTCDSTSKTLLTLFDDDDSCSVTAAELRENDLISGVLAADVDVLDASGNPGRDGTKESVSIGLGFSCVRATFTAPGEN